VGLVVVGLAVGSVAEISAQSAGYRRSVDSGYGALASRVVDASNRTGGELAALMAGAPTLPNAPVPRTARAEIQQGLDQAVTATATQAAEAAALVPPYPTGPVSTRFTQVMSERARATASLRTTIDRLLGMSPLPVAGAPSGPATTTPNGPLLSVPAAAASMAAAGAQLVQADQAFESLRNSIRARHLPIRLPPSVWVPPPAAAAPLSPARLAATASALSQSAALVPYHQLIITAMGFSPPAVTDGGPGVVGDSCTDPVSAVPGPTPTLVPPTGTLIVSATVTNCGTVGESGAVVSQTLTPVDPAGGRSTTTSTRITLSSGSSVALSMPPLPVVVGHTYQLVVAVAAPSQAEPAGSTQRFTVRVAP